MFEYVSLALSLALFFNVCVSSISESIMCCNTDVQVCVKIGAHNIFFTVLHLIILIHFNIYRLCQCLFVCVCGRERASHSLIVYIFYLSIAILYRFMWKLATHGLDYRPQFLYVLQRRRKKEQTQRRTDWMNEWNNTSSIS